MPRKRSKNNGNGQKGKGHHGRGSVTVVAPDKYQFESIAQYFNHWASENGGRIPWKVDREHLRITVPSQWITGDSKKEISRLGGSLADR